MAVDTAAKRASAANFDGWHLPFPDGSDAENSAERAAVLGLYAMAAAVGATVTFLPSGTGNGSYTDGTNAATYTFASVDFGAEAADRYIALGFESRATGATPPTINGVTIGGVAAVVAVSLTHTNSNQTTALIAIAAVPAGTSGTVEVALSATQLRAGMQVFRVIGIDGDTPSDTGSNGLSGTGSVGTTIDVPATGILIGAAGMSIASGGAPDCTWTGLTEHGDDRVETFLQASGAADDFASQQTGLSVSVAVTNQASSEHALVLASWAPTAGVEGVGAGTYTGMVLNVGRLMAR